MSEQPTSEDVMAAFESVWAEVFRGAPVLPQGYADGTLTVATVSRAWHTQLRLIGPNLAAKLNKALPAPIINSVRVRLDPIRILVTGSRTWTNTRIKDGSSGATHTADLAEQHGIPTLRFEDHS